MSVMKGSSKNKWLNQMWLLNAVLIILIIARQSNQTNNCRLVKVDTMGLNGGYSHIKIYVNNALVAANYWNPSFVNRGFTFVILDGYSLAYITQVSFDVCGYQSENTRLNDYLAGLTN